MRMTRSPRAAMSKTISVAIVLGALACSAPAHGQDWRTLTSTRQYAGERSLSVELEYGAGTLSVQPGNTSTLYRALLRYDADMVRPVTEYSNGSLHVGID